MLFALSVSDRIKSCKIYTIRDCSELLEICRFFGGFRPTDHMAYIKLRVKTTWSEQLFVCLSSIILVFKYSAFFLLSWLLPWILTYHPRQNSQRYLHFPNFAIGNAIEVEKPIKKLCDHAGQMTKYSGLLAAWDFMTKRIVHSKADVQNKHRYGNISNSILIANWIVNFWKKSVVADFPLIDYLPKYKYSFQSFSSLQFNSSIPQIGKDIHLY